MSNMKYLKTLVEQMKFDFRLNDEALKKILFPKWARTSQEMDNHFRDVMTFYQDILLIGENNNLYKWLRKNNQNLDGECPLTRLARKNGPRVVLDVYQEENIGLLKAC